MVAACRKAQPNDRVPVWFMRQAGRSLPEYRASRKDIGMLESCMRPDLVAEITMQPVRRYGVDAAILYSDIMLPLKAAGVDLEIVSGRGPVIAHPVRTPGDLEQLRPLDPERLWYVTQAVELITSQLGDLPLIGFAGAPFTLASYLVEGGPSRDYAATKALMVSEPSLWEAMCIRLADLSAVFLQAQVAAGATVVQLFDSWAGSLSAEDYRRYAQTGGCRWPRPAVASVIVMPCRATSIRRCCRHLGRCSPSEHERSSPRVPAHLVTSSISAMECHLRPIQQCWR